MPPASIRGQARAAACGCRLRLPPAAAACGCRLPPRAAADTLLRFLAALAQSALLGTRFRNTLYPGEMSGVLRLHSTYRHDLKIYSSDEGRVQMTAAAFAKGFLDLEVALSPPPYASPL